MSELGEAFAIRKEERRREREGRLDEALLARREFEQWCSERRVVFTVHNEGHHWKCQAGRALIEWWPASGKVLQDRSVRLRAESVSYLKDHIAEAMSEQGGGGA